MTVRVVSFNLLVPIYAAPHFYIKCQSRFLETNYRWNLIQSQLEEEMTHHENTIICLQELSLALRPKLELFFRRHNYVLYSDLYGNRRNDYMGVGIAIPCSMQLDAVSYIKMGDHLRSIARAPVTQSNLFGRITNLWWQFVWSKFYTPVADPWKIAVDKANSLICLQVAIDGKPLCIGTYHMPCIFRIPHVMIIHASAVKDRMLQLAAGQNMILAGDFNSKPSDMAYQVLTERGYVDGVFPQSNTHDVSYRPNGAQILKSAYREKNGTEPVYTNYVDTVTAPNFRATLDYIFFDGRLEVQSVRKLPDQPESASYPDEEHPSDHLMIAASFRLL